MMEFKSARCIWVLWGDNLGGVTSHFGSWLRVSTSQVSLKLNLVVVCYIVEYCCGLPPCTMVSYLAPLVRGTSAVIIALSNTIYTSPLDPSIWVSSPKWMGFMLSTTNASCVHDLGSSSTCHWTLFLVFLLIAQGCAWLALCHLELVIT
jgi:hypothetical protein